MHLQSENHSVQLLAALQKKSRNGCEIFISGNDYSRSQSDSLWLLSPLVRSIIDSLGNIRDNLIILPDFSYQEIKTGLEITEGNKEEVLMFNSSTKHLLETLGMDLRDSWTTGVSKNFSDREIKTEQVDEQLTSNDRVQEDDEDDDLEKSILTENPDCDISDDEKKGEEENVTIDKLTSSVNIKAKLNQERIKNKKLEEELRQKNAELEEVRSERNPAIVDKNIKFVIRKDGKISVKNTREVNEIFEEFIEKREDKKHYCKICDFNSLWTTNVTQHMESLHITGISYPCRFCRTTSKTTKGLKMHENRKHKETLKKQKNKS